MTALVCGSLAFDTVMVFQGRFREQILADRGYIVFRVDNRIAQATYAYARASTFATNRVATADAKLEASVASFDTRVAIGVKTLVTAATGVSNFVIDHVDDADTALTNRMSRLDARVDAFIDLTHGQSQGSTNRPTSSLPWAATSLTLVLGTLGAATGASVALLLRHHDASPLVRGNQNLNRCDQLHLPDPVCALLGRASPDHFHTAATNGSLRLVQTSTWCRSCDCHARAL